MAATVKEKAGERAPSPLAVPPRAAPGSAWPGALRIDVELAESHARRMAPGMQVTSRNGQLGGRRKVASPSTSPAAKNEIRLNNQAEITKRRQNDDKNETGKKDESGAESRLVPESVPLRTASRRGGGREKSEHGNVATRSTGQKKQRGKQLSVLMSKKLPHAAGRGVGGKDVGSPCDARTSPTSKETREGKDSAARESSSNCEGKRAATHPSSSTTEKDKGRCRSAVGATVTAAAAVVSLEVTEQDGGVASRESSEVEDGREDQKIRVDGERATGLLNKAKDRGRAETSCQLHSPASTDVEEARRHHTPQPAMPMGQVAMLMHQVGLGMQMVVAITLAASKGQDGDQVRSIITATDPEASPSPAATRAPCSPVTVGRPTPHQAERKLPSPTFPDSDAASLDLRKHFVEVRDRCRSSIKALRAASAAVAVPGEKLRRSFEAYCHAHGSLQKIEASIRCAEEQETTAVAKLRRASEAVVMAQMELSRAGTASCDRSGASSSYPSMCLPSILISGSINDSNREHNNDDDGNNNGGGPPARPSASSATAAARAPAERVTAELPRQDKRNENTEPKNKARGKIEDESKRPRLMLASEIARGVAEQAVAEKRRAEAEADSALILVGALAAGDWTLAVEACDTARAVYEKVAEETVPKLQEFRNGVRLFQHLSNLMMDARRKLDLSLQVGQAASRGGGGRGTGYDEKGITIEGDGNGSDLP